MVWDKALVGVERMDEVLQEVSRLEADTRHDLAIFLILYLLVGLDLFSIKDEKQREKMTAAWVSWGVVFVLIGFFILAPARAAEEIARTRKTLA